MPAGNKNMTFTLLNCVQKAGETWTARRSRAGLESVALRGCGTWHRSMQALTCSVEQLYLI